MNGNTESNISNISDNDTVTRNGEILAVFDGLVQEPTDQHRHASKKVDIEIDTMTDKPRQGAKKNATQLFQEMMLGEMTPE